MEGIPEKEKKRLGDLARYAQDEREQRYWEIYWARRNVFPAAMRSIMTERAFRKWWRGERDSQSRWFDPGFVTEMEPVKYEGWEEDPRDWPGGPEEWVKGRVRAEEEKFIDGGVFDLPKRYREGYVLKKERDIERAVRFVVDKFFGRRFYGNGQRGHYARAVEQILNRTMYGYDLRLAEAYEASIALRKILRAIRETEDDKEKLDLMQRALDLLWQQKKREKTLDAEVDVDPLETRGKSWRRTRREHIIAKFGPKALADGLNLATSAAERAVRGDRQEYKRRAVLNAIARSKIESVVHALTGEAYGDRVKGLEDLMTVATRAVDPYTLAAKVLDEELKNAKQGDEKAIKGAVRRAAQRLLTSGALSSVATPALLAQHAVSAVMDFYRDYYRKHGRLPIIQSMDDAEEILEELEREIERRIRGEPHYYLKGYVLGKLRRARQALKADKARS